MRPAAVLGMRVLSSGKWEMSKGMRLEGKTAIVTGGAWMA